MNCHKHPMTSCYKTLHPYESLNRLTTGCEMCQNIMKCSHNTVVFSSAGDTVHPIMHWCELYLIRLLYLFILCLDCVTTSYSLTHNELPLLYTNLSVLSICVVFLILALWWLTSAVLCVIMNAKMTISTNI